MYFEENNDVIVETFAHGAKLLRSTHLRHSFENCLGFCKHLLKKNKTYNVYITDLHYVINHLVNLMIKLLIRDIIHILINYMVFPFFVFYLHNA